MIQREYSNEEYNRAAAWLKDHGCKDFVYEHTGWDVIDYYWSCLDQCDETD